jgi:hypothetical protein
MFDFDELDRFMRGELGEALTVSPVDGANRFWFERHGDGRIVAFIPVQGDRSQDPFDIAAALTHLSSNPKLETVGSHYRITVRERHELYALFKLACNHLNWHDHAKLKKNYL